ncbi:expressed protein [Arabidopsis lyrata subsp. lyrata]|uniref:Expressed protein n=1 Tax=Arabidopsis lyrata subsp. lyrata TaxID=81972 RepID=D7KWG2_ARALL|nr:expressed protein [Arabidopsis lyrata subsp. lyrata]
MHPFRIFSSIVLSNSPLFFSIPLNDASGSELLFTIPIPSSYLQNSPLRKACIRFFDEGQRIMLEIVK